MVELDPGDEQVLSLLLTHRVVQDPHISKVVPCQDPGGLHGHRPLRGRVGFPQYVQDKGQEKDWFPLTCPGQLHHRHGGAYGAGGPGTDAQCSDHGPAAARGQKFCDCR